VQRLSVFAPQALEVVKEVSRLVSLIALELLATRNHIFGTTQKEDNIREILGAQRIHLHTDWSERSACAAQVALQMGCVANVVATKFIVFFSLSFLFYALLLFSDLDMT
jgi:hypothetical protein